MVEIELVEKARAMGSSMGDLITFSMMWAKAIFDCSVVRGMLAILLMSMMSLEWSVSGNVAFERLSKIVIKIEIDIIVTIRREDLRFFGRILISCASGSAVSG